MHPDDVPLTLAECDELARDEGAADGWELAGRYASRMLPQIFRPDSPVLALKLAPEHQRALEKLLAGLHPDTFQASDSLGWVYQFWQTKRKDEVNRSEVKIGADELPAVTRLFTEPYMVAFLLDNSLGAWWAVRRLSQDDLRTAASEDELRRKAAIPGVPLEYLRFVRTPAASPSNAISASTVVRASSPDSSGQDGLTTQPRPQLELSDESRALVAEARKLDAFSDDDGICCLPSIRGEPAAHERLLRLLEAAYGDDWTAGTLSKLLAESGAKGKSLESWLRDAFFEQHCKLFHHRPFIWHIWDGLKDGFAALVNYHKLDRANLERLIYTYLGDWIRMQERTAADGAQGADERLAAAKGLKAKLEAILEGEAPLDIFVRWKPIEEQSIGWKPDLNDGVRLNIRPFMLAGDVGKKGAGVLRAKPNIHGNKDRGKDVESAPWYHLFKGDRINDHHLTLAEKRAAKGRA
jgi:hypothetical protein